MHPLINLETARAKAIETASIVAITVTESIAAVSDYLYHDSIIIGDVDEKTGTYNIGGVTEKGEEYQLNVTTTEQYAFVDEVCTDWQTASTLCDAVTLYAHTHNTGDMALGERCIIRVYNEQMKQLAELFIFSDGKGSWVDYEIHRKN